MQGNQTIFYIILFKHNRNCREYIEAHFRMFQKAIKN